jgi:hypothetical protein
MLISYQNDAHSVQKRQLSGKSDAHPAARGTIVVPLEPHPVGGAHPDTNVLMYRNYQPNVTREVTALVVKSNAIHVLGGITLSNLRPHFAQYAVPVSRVFQ